jgi:hypothetical protein
LSQTIVSWLRRNAPWEAAAVDRFLKVSWAFFAVVNSAKAVQAGGLLSCMSQTLAVSTRMEPGRGPTIKMRASWTVKNQEVRFLSNFK